MLNSSGLDVFKMDRVGLDVFKINRLGRMTFQRWDFCGSATLPWYIAGQMWVEGHRSCVRVGETVGKRREVDEMGENLCLWSVSSATYNET